MEDKYINGLIIRSQAKGDDDNVWYELKVSAKVDELIEDLKELADEKGWCNFVIRERKNPSDKGITHYAKYIPRKPKQDWASDETREKFAKQIPENERQAFAQSLPDAPQGQEIKLEDIPF